MQAFSAGRSILPRLGSLCWRYAGIVVLAWLCALLVGGLAASELSERLLSGSGDIEGSISLRVDHSLRSDFTGSGDAQSLILVFRSTSLRREPGELSVLVDSLKARLATQAAVADIRSDREIPDPRLAPKDPSGHFILIELQTKDALTTEQEVPKLRAVANSVLQEVRSRHADLDWAITGRAALTHDLNQLSAKDTARSEIKALPLTLLILIFAFGSLGAAILPLLLALAARTVALGTAFLLAGSLELSNLVQSIVTMLAIALGIDYSLFIVHRYRQELARLGADAGNTSGAAVRELAMRGAMEQSGAAVLYSGATVAIAMGALLATPLMQTRSIGIGGLLVVLITLLASLTLMPALLKLMGPRLLEWPSFLSRRTSGARSQRLWGRWADIVLSRPLTAIALSLALLLSMAAPALQTRFGFPEGEFLPPEIEYARGMEMLSNMQLKGLLSPVLVLVSGPTKAAALSPNTAPALAEFVSRLETDPRVETVLGPVPSALGSPTKISATSSAALPSGDFISRDGSKLLFTIIPSHDSTLAGLGDLSEQIPAWLKSEGLRAEVGGQAQYYNDFDVAVGASYPLTLGLVLGMSALALLLLFRAPLASAKAIFLNLLSVAAGYGVVVLVFQLGYGSSLFGIAAPTDVVPITVPLVIFCILFGLSMDYEIFLLSRVRRIFAETGDNFRSVREGLADTGSVITSAALIMVAVFGAFAFGRVLIVQMIGLGLAVAVLVDATVIRSVLGPALMQLAGQWNWWPLKQH